MPFKVSLSQYRVLKPDTIFPIVIAYLQMSLRSIEKLSTFPQPDFIISIDLEIMLFSLRKQDLEFTFFSPQLFSKSSLFCLVWVLHHPISSEMLFKVFPDIWPVIFPDFRFSGFPVFRFSGFPVFRFSGFPVFRFFFFALFFSDFRHFHYFSRLSL